MGLSIYLGRGEIKRENMNERIEIIISKTTSKYFNFSVLKIQTRYSFYNTLPGILFY